MGDVSLAKNWLNTSTGRDCAAPIVDEGKRRIRLHVERFVNYSNKRDLVEIQYITSGILDNLVTPLSDKKYAIFPWVGTRQLMTLHYALLHRKVKSKLPWITCVYLEVIFSGTPEELEDIITDILKSDLDLYGLPLPDKVQINGKYNEFIPLDLLRKQFVEDYLDFEGLANDIKLGK